VAEKRIHVMDRNLKTIFVSVPTMEDYDYAATIKHLFKNAKYPERVYVGSPIYLSDLDQLTDPEYKKFWVLDFDPPEGNYKSGFFKHADFFGVGRGRLNALQYYNNEDYFFQIDSHMRFRKDWDVDIINEFEDCKTYFGERVLLGNYAPGFDVETGEDGDEVFTTRNENKYAFWLYDDRRSPHFPVGWDHTIYPGEQRHHSHGWIKNRWLPAIKICAHNMFTDGPIWVNSYRTCLNEDLIFWGEELYQSALAYMRGYEFCHSSTPYVYHRYAGTVTFVEEKDLGDLSFRTEDPSIINDAGGRDYFTETKKYPYKRWYSYKERLAMESERINSLITASNDEFGYLPRTFKGYLKYAGIDLEQRKTKKAKHLPIVNPVFKKKENKDEAKN
jgi:hypothetical protein